MTANGPTSDWSGEVIDFLARNLPTNGPGEGWHDMAMTAYQIGCEALVALGQAEGTGWGAVPRASPRLPPVLPRWDDVCVAVLWLAHQQNMLGYRLRDGSVPPPRGGGGFVLIRMEAPPPPAPNIAAAHGLGPARAAPEVVSALEALGLVAQGRWTSAAETVLWRGQPEAWKLDVSSDPRFVEAVEQALVTMPDDVRAEMDRLTVITDEDVAAAIVRGAASYERLRARHGPEARIVPPPTTAQAVQTRLESARRNDLDWLLFRRWRLADGWLTPEAAALALEVFHDRLAIAVRRAVVARRYPDLSYLADK
jgi:hypothetical protein